MQNTQAKYNAMAALDDDFSAIFNFDDGDEVEEPTEQYCTTCAE